MQTSIIDDMLTIVSRKIYDSATQVIQSASQLIQANTFCIALNDRLTTTVVRSFNREQLILEEGLVVDNEESYCHLVIEKSEGPLIIENNITHPLTKDMDATKLVGGCSFMGVRIVKREGDVFGSLCAFDHNFYQYSPEEVALMESLAAFFASALELEDTVDALRKANQTIIEMSEDKSNLLATMSHEIRTPLNGVLGMVELLHTTELSDEQREYVEIIRGSGESLLTMINDILDYAKMEAGKMELDVAPFSIAQCMGQACDLFTHEAGKKGVDLLLEIDPQLPEHMLGDEMKVRQVLLNLISNAIKFTDQGHVRVTVEMKSYYRESNLAQLRFMIKDTGIGIPLDRVDQLFRSFSQLHQSSSHHSHGGTGLGLSICKQLVELMNGRIWLNDTSSEGSCFAFELNLPIEEYQQVESAEEVS